MGKVVQFVPRAGATVRVNNDAVVKVRKIVQFLPRAGATAQANCDAFVKLCKQKLVVFGTNLPFDENIWDVTNSIKLVGKNSAVRLVFSTFDSAKDKSPQHMSQPFLDFAKGYMRYQHAMRPTKSVGSRLAALRALEAALTTGGLPAAPWLVTGEALNRAVQKVKDKFSPAVAYRVGSQLQLIAEFMTDKHLVTVPVQWRCSLTRPQDTDRVGEEFDERRKEKLPSPAALNAVARIFRLATDPVDILVSSAAGLLCSAPDRINELLRLDLHCEVHAAVPSTQEQSYGLRWSTSKGGEPMVKWVIGSMVEVVREALVKIRKVTEPAREIARWYEKHPKKLYLLPEFEHLRKCSRVTIAEIKEILFTTPVTDVAIRTWCKKVGVDLRRSAGQTTASFDELQKAVIALLPKGLVKKTTAKGLRLGNALFVVQKNMLHIGRPTYRCVIDVVEQGDIYNRLGARSTSGILSIFDRFGLFEEDGSSIVLISHQFRHYLNTLAQAGGLSELDIAKWSGRADISQNKAYDHQSSRDVLALVRQAIGDDERMVGPLSRLAGIPLHKRGEFASLKVKTAHTTLYGYCIHDFTMLPCQVHEDCINCTEQICVKGDKAAEINIRSSQRETNALLAEAKSAVDDEWAGANRWVEHQSKTLSRLNELCAVLDDPNVPNGAIIQLSNVDPPSRLEQATNQRHLRVNTSHLKGPV